LRNDSCGDPRLIARACDVLATQESKWRFLICDERLAGWRGDIRDPDGYVIEVGQSKPEFKYG
jgi:hypothetical protein